MNTTLQIRIDKATKIRAQKKFKAMGLTLSSGIKYVLTNISKENDHVCEHGYKHSYSNRPSSNWMEEIEKGLKHAKKYSSVKAMFNDIEKSA